MSVRLYVGNLHGATSDADLRLLFEACGKVQKLDWPIDRDTGKRRGFAFIQMSQGAAKLAINALDGHQFRGRRLRVSKARQRKSVGEARPRSSGGPRTRTVPAVYRSVMSSGRPLAAPATRRVEVPAQRRTKRRRSSGDPAEPTQAATKLHHFQDGHLVSSPLSENKRQHRNETPEPVETSSSKKRKKKRKRKGQPPEETPRSVWTVSGGLPSLGKRR
ncbi:MAG: hypothetical protein F4X26_02410 [Chloroflexi bacterium]|nr:hypothetical protein [Chloroflexota bacterium]